MDFLKTVAPAPARVFPWPLSDADFFDVSISERENSRGVVLGFRQPEGDPGRTDAAERGSLLQAAHAALAEIKRYRDPGTGYKYLKSLRYIGIGWRGSRCALVCEDIRADAVR